MLNYKQHKHCWIVGIAKRDKLDVTHSAASGIFIIPAKEKLIDANAEDIEINDEEK